GGCRDFDLTAVLKFFVFRYHAATNLSLFGDQFLFFVFRELFPLFKKPLDERIFFPPKRIKPSEVKPYLKVSPILFLKVFLGPREMVVSNDRSSSLVQEFSVAFIRVDHGFPMSHKEILQDKVAFF